MSLPLHGPGSPSPYPIGSGSPSRALSGCGGSSGLRSSSSPCELRLAVMGAGRLYLRLSPYSLLRLLVKTVDLNADNATSASGASLHRDSVSRASPQKSSVLCTPPEDFEANASPLKVILTFVLANDTPRANARQALKMENSHKNIQLGLCHIRQDEVVVFFIGAAGSDNCRSVLTNRLRTRLLLDR